MKYRVSFAQPVVYQPDHLIARREVTELRVIADTPEQARLHAVRVTVGDPGEIAVETV